MTAKMTRNLDILSLHFCLSNGCSLSLNSLQKVVLNFMDTIFVCQRATVREKIKQAIV